MDTGSGEALLTCRAPFASMEFDPTGAVLACCANTLYPIGRVGESSLQEIWNGERARALRRAVAARDYSLGCTICSHRIRHHGAELPMLGYADLTDGHIGDGEEVDWPQRLSFSLHNTCNLECIMCGADRSSKIRSRRAGLPPLPHMYGDEFFDQLEAFLVNCRTVDFVGGEPFLIREHWRVWELLSDLRPDAMSAVTTNGTVWNDRVEAVLEQFDTEVRISLDALTQDVFEGIRVGTDFKEVMRNFRRFREYSRERGTGFSISFSFIRQNWFELADMLVWAEQLGVPVNVQTVIERDFGVQHMPDDELRDVLAVMQRQTETMDPCLVMNREVWDRQLRMIATELDRRHSGERFEPCFEAPAPWNATAVADAVLEWSPDTAASLGDPSGIPAEALAYMQSWDLDATGAGSLHFDTDGRLTAVELGDVLPDAVTPESCPTLDSVLDACSAALGGELWVLEELSRPDHLVYTVGVAGPFRDGAGTVLRLLAFDTTSGRRVLVFRDALTRPESVPVTLAARRGQE